MPRRCPAGRRNTPLRSIRSWPALTPALCSRAGALGDLPIVAIAAQAGTAPSEPFRDHAVRRWRLGRTRQRRGGSLAANGIPVIGLDSLRYFWSARSPQGLGADLDRMIRYYLTQLGKQRVVLIGYSQGADVLPLRSIA